MKSFDIAAAILGVIEAAAILPAAQENGTTQTRPYLDIQQATARRDVFSLRGGTFDRETGSYMVAVVVDEGTYTKAARDWADEVVALFPMALRIPFTGGVVTIQGVPDVRPGFNAEAEYRVPVVIPYIATAT